MSNTNQTDQTTDTEGSDSLSSIPIATPHNSNNPQANGGNGAANASDSSQVGKENDPSQPRVRRPTEKMKALLDQEQKKREDKFHKAYERWKQARETRQQLKQECTEEDIGDLSDKVEAMESPVLQTYNDLRLHGAPTQEIKRRMDACSAVTRDLNSLMQHRLVEVGDEWNDKAERLRLHSLLDREYAQSVYGTTLLNPSIASSEPGRSYKSGRSQVSVIATKRTEAAAELAAKEAELKAMEEEESEKAKLEQTIEAQRRQIKWLETQREIKVTRARMNVYDQEMGNLTRDSHPSVNQIPDPRMITTTSVTPAAANSNMHQTIAIPANVLRPEAPAYVPHETQPSPVRLTENDSTITSLAQVLQTSMLLGRLPLPEPTVFNGDPLMYTEWKAAFMALIDDKAISPQEKFYFLKKYVGKEAGKAIQGYFLSHTEASYQSAWKTLEERYGNPFILQKAFREKLATWATIGPKDAEGLREYGDFLQGCQTAMAHIPSLQVLNDCMENQRLTQKLPVWASTRWNRKVTKQLQETNIYPDFDIFVNFVVDEARVACNPVSSLSALSEKLTREPKRKQASVMATTTILQVPTKTHSSRARQKG